MDPKIPGFVHALLMTTLDTFCHPNAPRSWEYLIRRLQEPQEPPPFHHHHTSAALSLNMQTCSPQQVASYKNDEKMGSFSNYLTKILYLQIPPPRPTPMAIQAALDILP